MKSSSPYLPPEGKYKPTPLKEASAYGYPWQHNPMVHKTTSDPFLCRSRHVFRRYKDNLVVYTRTADQITHGLYTYYLYDEHANVIETGEVVLPLNITDDNWHLYKYKSYDEQSAYIYSLGNRTNVMQATYQPTRVTAGGASLCFHPLKTIRCYPLIEAHNAVDAAGSYITPNSIDQYDFIFNTKEDVGVCISAYQSVTSQWPVQTTVQAPPQPVHLIPITAKRPPLDSQPANDQSSQHHMETFLPSEIGGVVLPSPKQTINTVRSHSRATPDITMALIPGHHYQCDTLLPPGSLWAPVAAAAFCYQFHSMSGTELIPALHSFLYNYQSSFQLTDVKVSPFNVASAATIKNSYFANAP